MPPPAQYKQGFAVSDLSDADQTFEIVKPDLLADVTTEALLETALARLAASRDRGAAIAQAAIEEALRQMRKRSRPICGGESDAR